MSDLSSKTQFDPLDVMREFRHVAERSGRPVSLSAENCRDIAEEIDRLQQDVARYENGRKVLMAENERLRKRVADLDHTKQALQGMLEACEQEVADLKHDLSRSMANHCADLNAPCGHPWDKIGIDADGQHFCAECRVNLVKDTPWQSPPPSELPAVLFDGFAVFQEVKKCSRGQRRTSAENVGDVLDAVVRLLRQPSTKAAARCPHGYELANLRDGTDTCAGCADETRACLKCGDPLPVHWSFSFCNVCRDLV